MQAELEKRKLIELNLSAAKEHLSPLTGFVHEQRDLIPVFENFCYILALLRSRIAENVLEAKGRLEKLLPFEVEGNFPLYLHEYPQCKDRAFSLDLLPVFHWIVTEFATAIGDELTARLAKLIGRVVSHGYKMHRERHLRTSAEFRLKSYFEPAALPAWNPATPEEWAEALISVQMGVSLGPFPKDLLNGARERWHAELCTYAGIQQQEHIEPKPTLFDLFMGYDQERYSRRALEDRRLHLKASLIRPFEEEKKPQEERVPWDVIDPASSIPYALYWGSAEMLHSLIFDPFKTDCAITREKGKVAFSVSFREPLAAGQDAVELAFFLNLHSIHDILVDGVKATIFPLDAAVDLLSGEHTMRLEMALECGSGRFLGHISHANRPSQKLKNAPFEVFDWQIALRTLCRSDDCRLKIILRT